VFSGISLQNLKTRKKIIQSELPVRSDKMNNLVTFKATFDSNFDGNSTHYNDPSNMFAAGGFHFGFSNFLKSAKTASD